MQRVARLICIKALGCDLGQFAPMTCTSEIAERFRAFARLYERMAEQCWSEHEALGLRKKASECLKAAVECDAEARMAKSA